MQLQLKRFDIEILQQQAVESWDLDDDGESFAEEAVSRLNESDIELIEDVADVEATQFFLSVFAAWDGGDPEDVTELLTGMLEDLDIELSYDDLDVEVIESDDWEEGSVADDDDDDDEFDGY